MKSILLEFILNLLNFHWWIWIALVNLLYFRLALKEDDDIDMSTLGAGIFSGCGIYLFERWVGSAKSFGLVDALSAILMCVIVGGLFQSWQKAKESAAKKVANQQEGKSESTTKQGSKKSESSTNTGDQERGLDESFDGLALPQELVIALPHEASNEATPPKATKPIREINRHATGNPSTSSSVSSSTREKLEELKSLLDDGLINEKDYETKKNDLLRKM